MGHSLSFGAADSATIFADTGALADAAATYAGNMIKSGEDIEKALDAVMGIDGFSAL